MNISDYETTVVMLDEAALIDAIHQRATQTRENEHFLYSLLDALDHEPDELAALSPSEFINHCKAYVFNSRVGIDDLGDDLDARIDNLPYNASYRLNGDADMNAEFVDMANSYAWSDFDLEVFGLLESISEDIRQPVVLNCLFKAGERIADDRQKQVTKQRLEKEIERLEQLKASLV